MAGKPVLAHPVPARLGPWVVDDLGDLPDDGNRYEIDDGSLLVSPPPGIWHQDATAELVAQLRTQAPPDLRVLVGPGILMGASYRIPDIVVATAEAVRAGGVSLDPGRIRLVVEVVSPGSPWTDGVVKPALYAAWRLPLFWRVRPRPAVRLEVLELRGDAYELVADHPTGRVPLAAPFPLTLDLDRLADEP